MLSCLKVHYSEASKKQQQQQLLAREETCLEMSERALLAWLLGGEKVPLFAFLVHFLTSCMSATGKKKGEPLRLTEAQQPLLLLLCIVWS